MNLAEFIAHAREIAAEMYADPGARTSGAFGQLSEAIELLNEYADDARAHQVYLPNLPRYISIHVHTIERLQADYEELAKRAKLEKYTAVLESSVTSERLRVMLSTIAGEAGMAFIPSGRIVLECGYPDEVIVHARLNRESSDPGSGGSSAVERDTHSGLTRGRPLTVTAPDGRVQRFTTMSQAIAKLAELYPGATRCRAYVQQKRDGHALSARGFLLADIKAQRLPKNAVTFDDAGSGLHYTGAPQ